MAVVKLTHELTGEAKEILANMQFAPKSIENAEEELQLEDENFTVSVPGYPDQVLSNDDSGNWITSKYFMYNHTG